jgi:acyl carrier protein
MEPFSIRRQLVEAIAAAIQVNPDDVQPTVTFDAMGFDSLSKVGIVPTLEKAFACMLQPDVLFDYPTVESLAKHIGDILTEVSESCNQT